MKRSPWLSKSSWHHDLHKCQILDYFVDEMIEGQKCIIHPHPSQKLSPLSADGHLYFLVAEGLLVLVHPCLDYTLMDYTLMDYL